MKKLNLFFTTVLAILFFTACNEQEVVVDLNKYSIIVGDSQTFEIGTNGTVIIPFTTIPANALVSNIEINCDEASTSPLFYSLKVSDVSASNVQGVWMAKVVLLDGEGNQFTPNLEENYQLQFKKSYLLDNRDNKSDFFDVNFEYSKPE